MDTALAVPVSTESSTLSAADDAEMEQIRAELYEALERIEGLRQQHPYEASGHTAQPL
ncbi:hypothetical protein ACIPW9_36220 [Streptomyces sp. NPDC090052]|uniref:hypothetical protein n=1 Tax=Streptomyces sp. NPDC090052 TaxID=3365931 RepID=UPI00381B8EDE